MELFATYCSAEKDGAEGELPAIERYTSERIQGVAAAAKGAQAKFGILSGQFGLITGEHPLPYYDHLLQPEEVSTRAEGAVETLRRASHASAGSAWPSRWTPTWAATGMS